MVVTAEAAARLEALDSDGRLRLVPRGPWTLLSAGRLEREIDRAVASADRPVVIDLSDIDHIDTAGGWLITRLERGIGAHGVKVDVEGGSDNVMRLLEALQSAERELPPRRQRSISSLYDVLVALGIAVHKIFEDVWSGFGVLGGVAIGLLNTLRHPSRFRITSMVFHIDRTGLRAVPIVALMSFLIGGIIAQQSAFQLRPFGAEVYVVDLVGVLVLRELGVLLTAIMIAGRSGSAFTAEIGSMKMREEIDALDVIGLDVNEVLVLPRILALIVALPLLTVIADFAALVGGGLVSWIYIGLPPSAFIARLRDAVYISTFWVGIIKAPFMALIIGIIAATEGFRVQGSAESLGAQTTSSVVKSIFMVIVVDGVFAMYFSAVSY